MNEGVAGSREISKHRATLILCILVTIALYGCGANYHSVYREYSVTGKKDTTSVLIDAKQRAIISARVYGSDANKPGEKNTGNKPHKIIVCAEPSPDALSAISSAFSSSLSAGVSDKQVQGAFASAIKESAKQLGKRNATIQLLRDALYRQCEAYMNGLIDKETYEQISNKYLNATVVMLAIEQITPKSLKVQNGGNGEKPPVTASTNINVTTSDTGKAGASSNPQTDGSGSGGSSQTSESKQSSGDGTKSDDSAKSKAKNSSITSSATAGSPVVAVNLNKGGEQTQGEEKVSEHVSAATVRLVSEFLYKDTLDTCLYRLPRLIATNIPDENKQYAKTLFSICESILKAEKSSIEMFRKQYLESTFLNDENTRKLECYIQWDGNDFKNKANLKKLKDWMKKNGIPGSVTFLLNSKMMREARRKAVSDLSTPGC